MSTDGEEKSTADITVRLTGNNTLSTDDYVFYGMNITGKGSLILDCLNTMTVQGIIYYGANKPTKSAFYQQSHVEYKNGVLTPGGLDLDIDGDLFVRNGKLNTGLFDDPDEAPFDYREAPFSYTDGVLTFRGGTVISEITFTAIGDVKYVFDEAAELSSDYSTVFHQVYGSASFEAADGVNVKIKSDQDSAIRAYSAVSFNGGGRITVEAPVYYNAVHADAVICGGEVFTSCNGTKCYISNKSAVFGNDTTCIYLDGAYFSPSENGSYYACDENVGWLNTKNTDTALLYARKIRKTIGNTTATSIRLTMKNADIAGKK